MTMTTMMGLYQLSYTLAASKRCVFYALAASRQNLQDYLELAGLSYMTVTGMDWIQSTAEATLIFSTTIMTDHDEDARACEAELQAALKLKPDHAPPLDETPMQTYLDSEADATHFAFIHGHWFFLEETDDIHSEEGQQELHAFLSALTWYVSKYGLARLLPAALRASFLKGKGQRSEEEQAALQWFLADATAGNTKVGRMVFLRKTRPYCIGGLPLPSPERMYIQLKDGSQLTTSSIQDGSSSSSA